MAGNNHPVPNGCVPPATLAESYSTNIAGRTIGVPNALSAMMDSLSPGARKAYSTSELSGADLKSAFSVLPTLLADPTARCAVANLETAVSKRLGVDTKQYAVGFTVEDSTWPRSDTATRSPGGDYNKFGEVLKLNVARAGDTKAFTDLVVPISEITNDSRVNSRLVIAGGVPVSADTSGNKTHQPGSRVIDINVALGALTNANPLLRSDLEKGQPKYFGGVDPQYGYFIYVQGAENSGGQLNSKDVGQRLNVVVSRVAGVVEVMPNVELPQQQKPSELKSFSLRIRSDISRSALKTIAGCSGDNCSHELEMQLEGNSSWVSRASSSIKSTVQEWSPVKLNLDTTARVESWKVNNASIRALVPVAPSADFPVLP